MAKERKISASLAALLVLWLGLSLPVRAGERGIIISAAASMTELVQALGRDFNAKQPGITITFNFGASGDLLAQISQGAPVDIFISASENHMDRAQEKGLIEPASRRVFAGNTLVLARPAGSTLTMSGLADLPKSGVARIGIGKPESVPAGQYAKEALVRAGIWKAVEEKLIFGSSVRQVLDYLRRGEVDCGLVYATDVMQAKDQVNIVAEVGEGRIRYPAGMVRGSHDPGATMLFLDYLATDAARAVIREHGFSLP